MLRPGVLNVRDMNIMIISVLQRVNIRIVSSDEVDVSKIIEKVHVPFKTVSIIEDTAVGTDTLVIDEIHMSDSASDDVNEIVEPITLHLSVAYIDDITKPIALCNDTHKFAVYPYSTLQEFVVDNKVMVASRFEALRKLHAWRRDFDSSEEDCFHCLRVG